MKFIRRIKLTTKRLARFRHSKFYQRLRFPLGLFFGDRPAIDCFQSIQSSRIDRLYSIHIDITSEAVATVMGTEQITLLSTREIDKMRRAGALAAELLDFLEPMVKPGVSTLEINDAAEKWTRDRGAVSAPLGYGPKDNPFTASLCTSVNEVICHGIPNARQILKHGDIINIDVTPILDGYHGDTSKTFFVGEPSPKAKKLVEVTEECLKRGIAAVKPGARINEIGAAIQKYAEANGFSVVRDFVGHGVSHIFHTAPQIPHYYDPKQKRKIKPGMVFTIEPMINEGTWEAVMLDDGWTAITKDGKLSAQFEHTIAVTKEGADILTLAD